MYLKEIIKALEKCDIGNTLYFEDCEYRIFSYLKSQNLKFKYFSGATKLVLLFENCDYVIKIPFTGSSEEVSYYNEEYHEEYSDYSYVDFSNAGDNCGEWDYCEIESNNYKLAKEEDLKICFAGTSKLTTINGYPIYIQKRIKRFGNNYSLAGVNLKEFETIEKTCQNVGYYNTSFHFWIREVIKLYGKNFADRLLIFLKECKINDLRGDNIGYLDNKPVLVDYAGFHD